MLRVDILCSRKIRNLLNFLIDILLIFAARRFNDQLSAEIFRQLSIRSRLPKCLRIAQTKYKRKASRWIIKQISSAHQLTASDISSSCNCNYVFAHRAVSSVYWVACWKLICWWEIERFVLAPRRGDAKARMMDADKCMKKPIFMPPLFVARRWNMTKPQRPARRREELRLFSILKQHRGKFIARWNFIKRR